MRGAPAVERVEAVACVLPTDRPESDATLAWDSTTIVVVEVAAGGEHGVGWTYCDESAAVVVRSLLAPVVRDRDATDVAGAWDAMVHRVRNAGRPGVVSCAISAVDVALWDLAARLHGVPVVALVGRRHDGVALYGSGGFTSYTPAELEDQLGGWAAQGFDAVKMKIGRDPASDPLRMATARRAIGDGVELFVDANGAYGAKAALDVAAAAAELGVTWFEEPVSSDDLDGLRLVREHGPPGMDITAGEYGYDIWYFRRMLAAGAVDCLQADVTRCGGITGFLAAGALADAFQIDLSAHTAPQLSLHAGCGVRRMRHIEWFHDHVRIEGTLFDGVLEPDGRAVLHPDLDRPGLGLELRRPDVEANLR